jgi:hypothetical protein
MGVLCSYAAVVYQFSDDRAMDVLPCLRDARVCKKNNAPVGDHDVVDTPGMDVSWV